MGSGGASRCRLWTGSLRTFRLPSERRSQAGTGTFGLGSRRIRISFGFDPVLASSGRRGWESSPAAWSCRRAPNTAGRRAGFFADNGWPRKGSIIGMEGRISHRRRALLLTLWICAMSGSGVSGSYRSGSHSRKRSRLCGSGPDIGRDPKVAKRFELECFGTLGMKMTGSPETGVLVGGCR